MKFLVQQLRKYRKEPLKINQIIDLSNLAKQNFSDRLLNLKPVKVKGKISYSEEKINVNFRLNGTAILPSARSLKPVSYNFNILMDEIYVQDEQTFSTFDENQQVFLLKDNRLDLDSAILENIVTNLPMSVFKDDEKENDVVSGNGWKIIQENDDKINRDDGSQKLGDYFN